MEMEIKELEQFNKKARTIVENIGDVELVHAHCYLVNYCDNYICKQYNGGCKDIEKCREISERFSRNSETGYNETCEYIKKNKIKTEWSD